MPRYVVFMPDGKERVEARFDRPFRFESVPNSVWPVGTGLLTCGDVCVGLGMKPGELGGAVFKIEDFYGLWNPDLWAKLSVWRS